MVHCQMRVNTVITCEKVCLRSSQPFCPLTDLPGLIVFGLPMCDFGPCGFTCVVVASGPW